MKIFKGKVLSTETMKTAKVSVERIVSHPVYKKRYKRIKKYLVHDEIGVEVGQTVCFVASKPYSKLKKWIITGIVNKQDVKKNAFKKRTKKRKTVKSEP